MEIIHESLLTAWPRLVRWQTQDEEGAQLRDELRQAAQLWEQHGRSADRLWTGTAVKEFQIWRERYSGGLTSTEEAFAQAMVRHAERRKRRRRLAVTSFIVLLLAGMSVISAFWQRSEKAREEAVLEAQRREAAQLLALAQLEIDDNPTGALAYTIASLESADNSESRRFAVETLWRGPHAFILGNTDNNTLDFSPDGRWLALGGMQEGVQLWSHEGGPPRSLVASEGWPPRLAFGPDSDTLYVASRLNSKAANSILVVSVPDGDEVRRLNIEPPMRFWLRANSLITSNAVDENTHLIRMWPLPLGEAKTIGHIEVQRTSLNRAGTLMACTRDNRIFLRPLNDRDFAEERLIGKHEHRILGQSLSFDPGGQYIAIGDESGEICFWPLAGQSKKPIRRFQGLERMRRIGLDPKGKWMASGKGGVLATSVTVWLWDLVGSPDADPLPLRNSQKAFLDGVLFHPNGRWLAMTHGGFGTSLWPLSDKYSRVLGGHSAMTTVTFHPDGRSLVSASYEGTVRTWPLYANSGRRARVLLQDASGRFQSVVDVDSVGRNTLVTSRFRGGVFLVPLEGGSPRMIGRLSGLVNASALSDDGRLAAAAAVGIQSAEIHIWDLESGQEQVLNAVSDTVDPSRPLIEKGGVWSLSFMPDGRLFSAGGSGFRLWDLSNGTSELLHENENGIGFGSISPDGRYAIFLDSPMNGDWGDITAYDMIEKRSWSLSEHGHRVSCASAFDPSGTLVVTGDEDGVVRVGPVTGETPHLLFGHSRPIRSVAVSPDGLWIASSDNAGEIRLWPMPEGPPFHILPYDELLEKLRSFTNLRVIADEATPSGYRYDYARFPGWETVPEW